MVGRTMVHILVRRRNGALATLCGTIVKNTVIAPKSAAVPVCEKCLKAMPRLGRFMAGVHGGSSGSGGSGKTGKNKKTRKRGAVE